MFTQPQSLAAAEDPEGPGSALAAAALPPGWVSQALRDLERWMVWAICVGSAGLGLIVFPAAPVIWLFVLHAALIGTWAEFKPARCQAEMALRGIVLIAGAYVLHMGTMRAGDAIGPLALWLSITCLAYAFMLKPGWAALLAALGLFEFTVASLQANNDMTSVRIVQTGVVSLFAMLLAMKFGAVMRRPDEVLESRRIDNATALYNKAGFLAHGNDLLANARRHQRPVSVAVFDCADLLELRTIYGSRIARKVTARIVRKLTSLAAHRGFAARTGPSEFTVVLAGMGRDKAMAAIQRVLGNPGRIEFDAGDSEIVLVPTFAVNAVDSDMVSIKETQDELRRKLARIDEVEQRRQHYLQRERERHSRPMGMVSLSGPAHSRMHGTRVQLAKTLPVPLVVN